VVIKPPLVNFSLSARCGQHGKKEDYMTMRKITLTMILLLAFMATIASAEDKSSKIASFIQSEVNTGGYKGCQCKSLGADLVKCNLYFPAGTNTRSVEANVKGVAERFAQAGRLAATIRYIGYSGSQKVCEYKYDMYDATVTKTK
jgi:hypothetical protein